MASSKLNDPSRIRICMSYDGTDFFGWQKQKGQHPTVQGIFENCLSRIFDSEVAVVGSGRTDRGVHALNQWAHVNVPPLKKTENLTYKLHRMTPETITVKRVETCPPDFHAQISAESKRYVYRLFSRKRSNPFLRRYSWHYNKPIDLNFLQEASQYLMGEHDFSAFQSTGTAVSSTVRRVLDARWVVKPSGFIDFHITGNGFLKQMVRNIMGTLMWLHEQEAQPEAFQKVIQSLDRQQAGPPAPPNGLYLATVKYPSGLDIKCRKL